MGEYESFKSGTISPGDDLIHAERPYFDATNLQLEPQQQLGHPVDAERHLLKVETASRSGYYSKAARANGPGSALANKAGHSSK